jgi:hypothetical protein
MAEFPEHSSSMSGGAPSGADQEPSRFPPGGAATPPSQPVWEPGLVEVEFSEQVRPELVDTGTGPIGLRSPAAVDLSPLNQVLQRHGLQRAEPSITTTPQAATQAQSVALQRGIDVPHYGNFVTLHFPPGEDPRQIAQELNQLPEVVRAVPVPRALPPRVSVSDPLLGSTDQVTVDPTGGLEQQWYIFRCHADQAWARATGDGVVIADIDWGYRVTHQDLASRLDMSHAYNAYDGGADVTTGGSGRPTV